MLLFADTWGCHSFLIVPHVSKKKQCICRCGNCCKSAMRLNIDLTFFFEALLYTMAYWSWWHIVWVWSFYMTAIFSWEISGSKECPTMLIPAFIYSTCTVCLGDPNVHTNLNKEYLRALILLHIGVPSNFTNYDNTNSPSHAEN